MTLKEKTRFVREELEMTQREFAKLIGSNQTEVSFIERGFIPEDFRKIQVINLMFDLQIKGANDEQSKNM